MSVMSETQGSSPASAFAPLSTADQPGTSDAGRIPAGRYLLDPDHTLVTWAVNHMGFSILEGQFAAPSGTIEIDPADPSRASVEVTFDMTGLSVGVPAFAHHLRSPDLFDVARHATARFASRSVRDVRGDRAEVSGDLTLKGITRPLVLSAAFVGAGINPMSGLLNFGFSATGVVRRSDFDLGFAAPVVSDEVRLRVHAAFAAAKA